MSEDFSKYIVKEYQYWNLQLHHNQEYLGRLVVWCKRNDAVDLTDATESEQKELFVVLQDAKELLNKAFKPDILNYAFLANKTRHLHGHIVPRYKEKVVFSDVTFEDKLYGQNYRTDHSFETTEDLKTAVLNELRQYV